jgi:hypothetical protein
MLQQLRFYNASQPELFTGEVIRMRMIAPLAVWLVYVCLAAAPGGLGAGQAEACTRSYARPRDFSPNHP